MTSIAQVDELSVLVRRLAHALRQAAPDNALSDQAADYLKRHGLDGSPLRSGSVPDGWRDVLEAVLREMPGHKDDNGNLLASRVRGAWHGTRPKRCSPPI